MADEVLHEDDPTRDGNLSAEDYWAAAEERGRQFGACHTPSPDDYALDEEATE
jgi:hypothetical protein